MGLVNRPAVRHRGFRYADADLFDVVDAEMILLDQFGKGVNDSLHGSDAGIELEPDAHDLEVCAKIASDLLGLVRIGEDFRKAAVTFDPRRGAGETVLGKER